MSVLDDLTGLVSQYSSPNPPSQEQAAQHFPQVASQMPQSQLGGLLNSIFSSAETGTFGQNVSQLYTQSDPSQKAGILNRLLQAAGPGALADFTGGTITPEQTGAIGPEHVERIADRAQQQNPGIVREAADFYSQHPTLVKALGAGVAFWALRRL